MFNFIQRWRERRDERERVAREHQLEMLRIVVSGIETIADAQSAAAKQQTEMIAELTKGIMANAESFQTWIKSFQVAEAPTSSVVREEDEFAEEQKRFLSSLGVNEMPTSEIPAELALALQLQRDFAADVRRDNKP